MGGRLQNTNPCSPPADLLGLHPIDNGIQGRGNRQRDGRQQDMGMG